MLANVARWTVREQLQQEKLALGFYLSGHPYQEYAAELSNFIKLKLTDVTPQLAGQSSNNNGNGRRNSGVQVVLAGIVSGVRIQQTRRGRMAIVTLDDGSAQLEMTVFNEDVRSQPPMDTRRRIAGSARQGQPG